MAIQTRCPNCQTMYALADHLAGKTVRCKQCGGAIAVRAAKGRAEVEETEARDRIQTRTNAAKRPAARIDDEYDEEDYRRSPKRSNRGLVIGLIAGGVGCLVLLGGGLIVVVLLIASKAANSSFVDAGDWPPVAAPANGVVLHIAGVEDVDTRDAISEKLHELAAEGGNFNIATVHRGNLMTATVAPIGDVEAFSRKLDFGTVDSVKGRTITMTARKAQVPLANADALTKMLRQLKSSQLPKRQEAARTLKAMRPDDKRRPEVVKALEPLINANDPFTRHEAIEVLCVWANKDSVPLLLKALAAGDNFVIRGEVIKALGRLKDERAIEPIAQRLEEFAERDAAIEALKAMGPAAEKAVLARLDHDDWQVRQAACEILIKIGTRQSIPALEKVAAAGKGFGAGFNHFVTQKAEAAIRAIKARQ